MDEQELREVIVTAQKKFPGRDWSQLTTAEKEAVFKDYKTAKAMAAEMYAAPMPEGKSVGPSGIYVAPSPWASLAGAAQRAYGGHLMGKANQQEATGRQGLADLQTRRDALDRERDMQLATEEQRRREALLNRIFAGYGQ